VRARHGLWIVGLAITLSTARRVASGRGRWPLLAHAVQRSVLLVVCGLFLEGLPRFDLASWQVTGVLQKIAVAYLLAFGIFLWTDWRGQIVSLLGIFALYLGLMVYYPVPGCTAGPWESGCNFARYLDNFALGGHVWATPSGNDPDGILSVLSSTTSVLFGILVGQLVLSRTGPRLRTLTLIASGLLFVSVGMALSPWIPISKVLWTPSYSIFMAGLSAVAFGAVYWVVEERHIVRGFVPFKQFGVNAPYRVRRVTSGCEPIEGARHGQVHLRQPSSTPRKPGERIPAVCTGQRTRRVRDHLLDVLPKNLRKTVARRATPKRSSHSDPTPAAFPVCSI
jgi:predicted acyltransferase